MYFRMLSLHVGILLATIALLGEVWGLSSNKSSFGNNNRTINYSLLNQEETVSMTLANYFSFPAQVEIDYSNSSEGIREVLNISFTDRPVTEVSSLELTALDSKNISHDFNAYTLVKERSVFNHPNKVFLMKGNVLFSIRYQVSFSDNSTYVQFYRVASDDRNCSELEVQYTFNAYYLHVACTSHSGNTIYLHTYRFRQARPDLLSGLDIIGTKNVSTGPNCNRVTLYAYTQLYVAKTISFNQVLLYCTGTWGGASPPNKTHFISISFYKDSASVNITSKDDQTLTRCLQNSTQTLYYQNGFLSLAYPELRYYSFNRAFGQTECTKNFLPVVTPSFLAEVEDRGVQYVYLMNRTHITIKESYSPNFEVVRIDEAHIEGMEIVDFAIARRLLTVLYENETDYSLLAFDLHTSYPKLVDIIDYSKNETEVRLFSVRNYLTIGNYFVIYRQDSNSFKLNLYVGYEMTIAIKDSSQAKGSLLIALTDNYFESLTLNLTFRDFNDLTLQKSASDEIMLYEEFFNMRLSDYIIGPLGRFHNFPSPNISAFQYINHQHILYIGNRLRAVGDKVLAFSVNNELSRPILSFYFDNRALLSCELDYDLDKRETNLEECKTTKAHSSTLKIPFRIMTLSQQFYLQHDNATLEFCQLSPNGEYLCRNININIVFKTVIANIKLVSFSFTDSRQDISLMVYGAKEIIYCTLGRSYPSVYFSIYTNYRIEASNNPDLAAMNIVDLHFDKGYNNFLVLHLADSNPGKKVIVYEKPLIVTNSASALIGHVIEVFDRIDLEALFCLQNLMVLVTKAEGSFSIREYKVTKEYRLKFMRAYPLYDYSVREGGKHSQDQNFIFLAVSRLGINYTLAYCPLLPSSNLLVHRILTDGSSQLTFSQQISPIVNSSLMLLGNDRLLGITVPSLVFELTKKALAGLQEDTAVYQFSIGVVDSLEMLSILSYKFRYNEKEEEIDFLEPEPSVLFLNNSHSSAELFVDSDRIFGNVMDYKLTIPADEPDCEDIKITRQDIFTKEKCLIYYQKMSYGTLHDFAAITLDGEPVELVVTDKYLFCVKNRRLPTQFNPDFGELLGCTFITVGNQVLMTCISSTTSARKLFNLTISRSSQECSVKYQPVVIPDVLVFEDYSVMISSDNIVFEVPIRFENNKIYYKSKYSRQGVDENYGLLRRQKGPNVYQTEFQSTDSFLSGELLLLLEDGIGIYNLSDSKNLSSPALWLTESQLELNRESMVYVKFISLKKSQFESSLVVELGTTKESFEIEIAFKVAAETTSEQTVYQLLGVRRVFEYVHYPYCLNSAHSESQSYKNLIVKICDYTPVKNTVFANFISISNDTSNSLLQFYNRSGSASSSAAVRTELIISSTISEQEIAIRGDQMIVGSFFNLLCYYRLENTLSWTISHEDSDEDHECTARLTMFNKHVSKTKEINIVYDSFYEGDYWGVVFLYPQRIVLLLILLNTARLLWGRRNYLEVIRRRQRPTHFSHNNRFEVMVKINSKRNV